MADPFPSPRLRRALIVYSGAWVILLPAILGYLWWRGRRDPDYRRNLSERFGRYCSMPGAVWVHAVSLGEVRSADPLIRALLDRGEAVVVTVFTPAGRRAATSAFATQIADGTVQVVWVPFEFGWTYGRFFKAFAPKYGLVMEVEIWPRMILAARAAGLPLFMCNAQYPSQSVARDAARLPWRADLMRGFAGALVKSDLQAARFASIGVPNIHVTGELRFDQPIPDDLVTAGQTARQAIAPLRPVVVVTSAVEGEDDLYIAAMQAAPGSLFVYVPRAPERFAAVAEMIRASGLRMVRRTAVFDPKFALLAPISDCDVILGDSLNEMYFYIAMADRAIIGGGFHPDGAHNIIESLALKKPAIVGPNIDTIEYPAVEAIAAGVCTQVQDLPGLIDAITHPAPPADIDRFFADHAGAVAHTLAAIDRLTNR